MPLVIEEAPVEALAAATPEIVPVPVAIPAPIAEPAPPPQISALELQVLALVNGARVSRGLPPLEWDQTMADVARAHAADMARRGVVSHQGADGTSPNERLRRAGVQFRFGSENIWTYWGRVPEQGPSTMHAAMMAEPHAPGLWNHIGNILYTGYKRIGVGIVTAPNGVQYLSEKFAD
ncbi:MAG TPA: CAP domain-containing protein [Chloroflexota bacterium]|nr:CAP domain-containing protein [Chloroflexota bacterium]